MALHFGCQWPLNVAVKGTIFYERALKEYILLREDMNVTWLVLALKLPVNQTVGPLKYNRSAS